MIVKRTTNTNHTREQCTGHFVTVTNITLCNLKTVTWIHLSLDFTLIELYVMKLHRLNIPESYQAPEKPLKPESDHRNLPQKSCVPTNIFRQFTVFNPCVGPGLKRWDWESFEIPRLKSIFEVTIRFKNDSPGLFIFYYSLVVLFVHIKLCWLVSYKKKIQVNNKAAEYTDLIKYCKVAKCM